MTDDINNKQIFGPKGTGKTYALLRLKEVLPDTHYIDLTEGSKLIDNAQLFTYEMKCEAIRSKKVIAAFSPGAKVTAGQRKLS